MSCFMSRELAAGKHAPGVTADLEFLGGDMLFCELGEIGDPPLRDSCTIQ